MPNFISILWKLDALEFAFAPLIKQAELDLGGMGGKQCEIYAEPVPCCAERKRPALADGCAPKPLSGLRQRCFGFQVHF